jgi:peptidoglycan/LPS O-acetylase OafA/YrhL
MLQPTLTPPPGETGAAEPPAQVARRFDTIDLLRGLSIVGVVLFHLRACLAELSVKGAGVQPQYRDNRFAEGLPRWAFHSLFDQGGSAVMAFFAVSGFLITFVSCQRFGGLGKMRPARFYRIRFARIAPLLLLLLVYLSAGKLAGLESLQFQHGTLPGALVAALTFRVNGYLAQHGYLPPAWNVLWSLSVEEVFYLFFPLACVLFLRRRWSRPLFGVLLCVLAAVGPLARSPVWTSNPIWIAWSYLANSDCIAFGCATALLTHWLLRRRARVPAAALIACQWVGGLIALWLVMVPSGLGRMTAWVEHSKTMPTLLSAGVCLVMLGSTLRGRPGWRLTFPLRWTGRLSYEIYLTHELVIWPLVLLFYRAGRGPVAGIFVAILVLILAVGYAVTRLISEPANRWLRGAPLPVELTRPAVGMRAGELAG